MEGNIESLFLLQIDINIVEQEEWKYRPAAIAHFIMDSRSPAVE